MNEKLVALMAMANIETKDGVHLTKGHTIHDIQKFAELIVKECARISKEADDTWTNQGAASAQAFMEHFGIE
jgi:hypothetical protein